MTCSQFNRHVDAVLSGDLVDLSTRAARAHLEQCQECSRAWQRVCALREAVRTPEHARDVEMAVGRARTRLRQEFSRIGRPVVTFDSLPTPIGRVFVGMSDLGVCDVTLDEPSEREYHRRLARRAPEVWRDRDAVAPALTELEAYFRGRLTTFTVPIDLRGVTDFTRRVLRVTRRIRFGSLLSYGDVACRIGSPRGSRAVGGALGRNPVPIIVPCHRVITSAGKLGGFTGGLDAKRALLRIEGHTRILPAEVR